jgi:hypothetical protein
MLAKASAAANQASPIHMTDIKNPRLLYAKGALFVLGASWLRG